jgi:hypothetical protein
VVREHAIDEIQPLCLEIPGLEQLLEEFQMQSPRTRLYILTSPDPACFGVSPIDALRQVRDLIRNYGEMGS